MAFREWAVSIHGNTVVASFPGSHSRKGEETLVTLGGGGGGGVQLTGVQEGHWSELAVHCGLFVGPVLIVCRCIWD